MKQLDWKKCESFERELEQLSKELCLSQNCQSGVVKVKQLDWKECESFERELEQLSKEPLKSDQNLQPLDTLAEEQGDRIRSKGRRHGPPLSEKYKVEMYGKPLEKHARLILGEALSVVMARTLSTSVSPLLFQSLTDAGEKILREVTDEKRDKLAMDREFWGLLKELRGRVDEWLRANLDSQLVPVDFRRYVVEPYRARISFFLRRAKRAARKARKVKSKIVTVFDLEDHHQDPFPNYSFAIVSPVAARESNVWLVGTAANPPVEVKQEAMCWE